jgi:hypothetical protein
LRSAEEEIEDEFEFEFEFDHDFGTIAREDWPFTVQTSFFSGSNDDRGRQGEIKLADREGGKRGDRVVGWIGAMFPGSDGASPSFNPPIVLVELGFSPFTPGSSSKCVKASTKAAGLPPLATTQSKTTI